MSTTYDERRCPCGCKPVESEGCCDHEAPVLSDQKVYKVKFRTERNVQWRGGFTTIKQAENEARILTKNYKNVWIEETRTIRRRVWEAKA